MREDSLDLIRADFYTPFGLIGQPGYVGMTTRRYMHEFNVTPEQMGWVPVVSENAAQNPEAIFFDKPITIEDYMNSNLIVDPIRKLDCAPKVDGSIAIIVATTEKAKSLKQEPVIINSVASGYTLEGQNHTSYTRDVITDLPEMENMAKELYRVGGMDPKDIKVAMLDDFFSSLYSDATGSAGLLWQGRSARFYRRRRQIRVGGQLPVNPDGGGIGQGRFIMTPNRRGQCRQIVALRPIR